MTNVKNIKQKEIVFSEDELSNSINVLTSGNINSYININENDSQSYKLFSIPKNMLIGVESSLHCSKYNFTFKSDTDISISKTELSEEELVKKFFNTNKNYITYMMRSLSYTAIKMTDALHDADILYKNIATVLNNLSLLFWSVKEDSDYKSKNETINKMKEFFLDAKKVGINIPNNYDASFIKKHDDAIFNDIYTLALYDDLDQEGKLNFYTRLFKMPYDIQNGFFAYDSDFSLSFADDIAKYILYSTKTIKSYFNICSIMINEIYSKTDSSVFEEYMNIAKSMKTNNWSNTNIIAICNFVLDYITGIINHYNKKYENELDIDLDKIKNSIEENKWHVEENKDTIEIVSGVENMPQELDKSAKKLLDAANIDVEKSKQLLDSLSQFKKLKDKLSSDDEPRLIRKTINSSFFEVYEAIAKKVIIDGSKERLHQMFLDYSYFDENIISKKNIIDLYNHQDNTRIKNKKLKIYTQTDLLKKIYDKEIYPSINYLKQSYEDHLRERMKKGEFSENDFEQMFNSNTERFKYEINGLISSTQKLCYGQISTYSSILHEDMITKNINRSFLSKESIENAINNILERDFSAFYRETFYKNTDVGIEKEMILEEIYPEFILSPTYGSKSIMWQELNGRDRRSSGRIMIPMLSGEELNQMLLNSIGAFRWELCKSILGYSWNDISLPTLTSEYYDYVTFYRRNKDLGEEAREKLAAQFKKARSNIRDIFVGDYFSWLKYESESIIRLNKVARGIMYRNVPFAKELRAVIGKQPIIGDVANKFEGFRKKKAQDLENRYNRYKKENGQLPDELINHINFYKNL